METIKPTYCSFEQAKLLKEKGFDLDDYSLQHYFYKSEERFFTHDTGELPDSYSERFYDKETDLLCPEQSLVIEWLRVEHDIWIAVNINGLDKTFQFSIHNYKQVGSMGNHIKANYKTPQEAYSSAIDYVLNNLI